MSGQAVGGDQGTQLGAVIDQQALQTLVIGVVYAAHGLPADKESRASSAKRQMLAIVACGT